MMLECKNISVRYGELEILKRVSFEAREGRWLMLAGPNGAGKSTLINAAAGAIACTGEIRVCGTELKTLSPRERARLIGVLAQEHAVSYPFTVEEVVRLGRYAYSKGFFSSAPGDGAAVREALELTGLDALSSRCVQTLSGGELQRTFLAQALSQDPKVLLLDEPANHLDLVYIKQTFKLLREWLKTPGRAVISVVHDLSLALAYGDDALLLNAGTVAASGEIRHALSPDKLQGVYSMDVCGWMRELLGRWDALRIDDAPNVEKEDA